jgi:hypothetical protein
VEKSSSASTTSEDSRATLGAGATHRDADVGQAQRRRVVDAVAGHCHDVPAALERLDDAQLVERGDAGDHRGALQARGELFLAEVGDFRAGQHRVVIDGQAGGERDRARGRGVVAGQHDHRHAGLPAAAHWVGHRGAQRVGDRQEAERHQLPRLLGR